MLFNIEFPDKKSQDRFKGILKEIRELTGTKSWRILLTISAEYLAKIRRERL